jgi:hypothetical protein
LEPLAQTVELKYHDAELRAAERAHCFRHIPSRVGKKRPKNKPANVTDNVKCQDPEDCSRMKQTDPASFGTTAEGPLRG